MGNGFTVGPMTQATLVSIYSNLLQFLEDIKLMKLSERLIDNSFQKMLA